MNNQTLSNPPDCPDNKRQVEYNCVNTETWQGKATNHRENHCPRRVQQCNECHPAQEPYPFRGRKLSPCYFILVAHLSENIYPGVGVNQGEDHP
ncbi:MAG: hypothetical protein IPN90_13000 [Elusimicrobia bacterium]|nr:hypothetical protein [Elusimicrobiota bacterium]